MLRPCRRQSIAFALPALLLACGEVAPPEGNNAAPVPGGTTSASPGDPSALGTAGTAPTPGSTVTAPPGAGSTVPDSSAGAGSVTAPATATDPPTTETGSPTTIPEVPAECAQSIEPGRAPLRRLTRFEYNNSVQELLGDTTQPATSLPPELLGNGFGNDADEQPTSSFLAEQYGVVARQVASTAIANRAELSRYAPCVDSVGPSDEQGCATRFIEAFASAAFRRPVLPEDTEALSALQQQVRAVSSFDDSLAAVIEAVLQSPDFLYRIEFGEADDEHPGLRRPTGHEMASRLSYFLWGSMPDEALLAAADAGRLRDPEGVLAEATRMLDDPRSKRVIEFFFGYYLPLNTLGDLARDPELFPTFSNRIGSLMRTETQTFLEHLIFEGAGDWPSALTAPYTFVNEELAAFYGIPGVSGPDFVRVDLDPQKRLGLLTQGAITVGTTISNFTNPVRRGGFLLKHIMCVDVPPPPPEFEAQATPPDPYSGATGRERYTAHSQQPECAGCHVLLDPPGFALENYDAVGLWRDQENGVTIDASGSLAFLGEPFQGPIEMVQRIAASPQTHTCFADNWATFAYGRSLEAADECARAKLQQSFAASGYQIKQLLLDITQSETFLYLPERSAEETL